MAKKLKLFLAAFVAVFTVCGVSFALSNNAQADEERGAVLIQVSPTKQKISLTPGASYSGTFKVHNAGAGQFSYSAYATPYSIKSENYDSPDYASVTNYSQMADWITFDKATATGTLQPGEVVEVGYTVNVPEDVPAGGQYAVLMAQTDSGNAENATINTIHRVGCILYAAVPGETRYSGEIVKNNVNAFYFEPPLTVSSLVKNTGNIEATAKYKVKIYPLFSNEAVFNTEDAQEGAYDRDVIPETSRFNSITWEGAPSLGIFSVEQTIEFADQVSTVKKLVLICPLWLLFIIFALLFFIIFWLVSRARDRKRGGKKSRKSAKAEKSEKPSAASTSSASSDKDSSKNDKEEK